jgi:hypothetical protein
MILHSLDYGELATDIKEHLYEADPNLAIGTTSDGVRTGDGERADGKQVVLILLVDKDFERDEKRISFFQRHARRAGCVLPLILRDYEIVDYSAWWPQRLPEFKKFSLFVDFRGPGETLNPTP